MKFKDSPNWGKRKKYYGQEAVDLISTFILSKPHTKYISIQGDDSRHCQSAQEALDFLADKELLDLDYIDIYWNSGVGVTLEVWKEGGAFLSNIFTFTED